MSPQEFLGLRSRPEDRPLFSTKLGHFSKETTLWHLSNILVVSVAWDHFTISRTFVGSSSVARKITVITLSVMHLNYSKETRVNTSFQWNPVGEAEELCWSIRRVPLEHSQVVPDVDRLTDRLTQGCCVPALAVCDGCVRSGLVLPLLLQMSAQGRKYFLNLITVKNSYWDFCLLERSCRLGLSWLPGMKRSSLLSLVPYSRGVT